VEEEKKEIDMELKEILKKIGPEGYSTNREE